MLECELRRFDGWEGDSTLRGLEKVAVTVGHSPISDEEK
jgi:hypothetical protein